MKFLKVEWTKKRGAVALLATSLVVSSFILGGYVATGNWNPWGNRHYYQVLNANFQECYTPAGGSTTCQTAHNTIFNASAIYIEKLVTTNNEGFCTVSATCSFNFIAMSSAACPASCSGGQPLAKWGSTGASSATSDGACGSEGGTNVQAAGGEIAGSGLVAVAATVTDIPATGGTGSTSQLQKTFTASAIVNNVQQSCIVNQVATGASRVDLAAAVFPSVTLQINDQITITWTLTWSWT